MQNNPESEASTFNERHTMKTFGHQQHTETIIREQLATANEALKPESGRCWINQGTYEELFFSQGSITLDSRPPYCDRGNFLAKCFPATSTPLALSFDNQDGWPRYYFDRERAKLEIEAWLDKRNL